MTVIPAPKPLLGRCKDCDYALFATEIVQADDFSAVKGDGRAYRVNNGTFGRCPNRHRFFAMKTVKGTYSKDHKCDSRCLNAKGHDCTCSCGGANHGRGYAVTVVHATAEPQEVESPYRSESDFIGEVGKHIKGTAKLVNARWVREGYTRLYTFQTAKLDTIKWFCPKAYDPELEVGNEYTFRAKVKAHEDNHRFGKSTIVTYWEQV
jgi:hypothetical protein